MQIKWDFVVGLLTSESTSYSQPHQASFSDINVFFVASFTPVWLCAPIASLTLHPHALSH